MRRTSLMIATSVALFIPGCLNFPRDVDTNPARLGRGREGDGYLRLGLGDAEKRDLEQYLRSL
jgi:hypothetical protein